jgi:hypothetical protein
MSATNTNTSNTTSISTWASNFFTEMSNANLLNYALYNGVGGIPYATFGLIAAITGVLVYATATDVGTEVSKEIGEGLTQITPLEDIGRKKEEGEGEGEGEDEKQDMDERAVEEQKQEMEEREEKMEQEMINAFSLPPFDVIG